MDTRSRSIRPVRARLTAPELITAVAAFGILATLLAPAISALPAKRKLPDQVTYGREIYLGLRAYAADHQGAFPTYPDPATRKGIFMTSNEAFEALLPRYLDDKRPFFHKDSAWCTAVKNDKSTENRVLPGENDWCYVRGFSVKSEAKWPLLANALAPQSTSYVKDSTKPGGVWKGKKAVLVWVSGHAEMVELREHGAASYVPRKDLPQANVFDKDANWLAGEDVQVLFPSAPPHLQK